MVVMPFGPTPSLAPHSPRASTAAAALRRMVATRTPCWSLLRLTLEGIVLKVAPLGGLALSPSIVQEDAAGVLGLLVVLLPPAAFLLFVLLLVVLNIILAVVPPMKEPFV